jgi:hypothetical protein
MKLAEFRRRLEITFWIAAVDIMKTLKERKALLYGSLLFLPVACLATTLVLVVSAAAQRLARARTARPVPVEALAAPVDNPTQAPGARQQNTLVILVDQLAPKGSHLEGVWLAAWLPNRPKVTLLPLYPSAALEATDPAGLPVELFGLAPDGAPAPSFLDAIRTKDFRWDNLMVVDRVALARFIEMAGGVDVADKRLDGAMAVAKLPSAAESRQEALRSQAALATELCRMAPQIFPAYLQADRFNEIKGHVYTDPEFGQIVAGLAELRDDGGSLSCELPTLQEAFRHVPAN